MDSIANGWEGTGGREDGNFVDKLMGAGEKSQNGRKRIFFEITKSGRRMSER